MPGTFYDILEISRDAKLIDIKKAYRRLALAHHPDRNSGSAESTEKFKEISAAYEVLSDEWRRAEYDRALRQDGAGAPAGGAYGSPPSTTPQQRRRQQAAPYGHHRPSGIPGPGRHGDQFGHPRWSHADPFAQFDDLFRNDPFFRSAFDGMDDAFAKAFAEGGSAGGGARPASAAAGRSSWAVQRGGKGGGLGRWILNKVVDCLGIDLHIQTTTVGANGQAQTSRYTRGGGKGSASGPTYTSQQCRTFVQDGRRITVRSMERDGNRIEERLVDDVLVERTINGTKADVGQIVR